MLWQAANFLFGAAAEPHDLLHEPLFRILSSGLLTAGVVSLVLRVRLGCGSIAAYHSVSVFTEFTSIFAPLVTCLCVVLLWIMG